MRLPVRLWFRRLHLILGLALGAVLAVVAGSGASLVFRDEIRKWGTTPHAWDGKTDIGFVAARDLARSYRPDHALQILWFPNQLRPYYEAGYAKGTDNFTDKVRFHAATGEPLPIKESTVLDWLEELHVNLHMGETGAFLVRWSTLLFSLILLTGLYLWWPGWKPHLWIIFRRGRLRLWDTHRVLGFLSTIPLLAMLISGVVFAFPVASEVVYGLTGAHPPAATADLSKIKSKPPLPASNLPEADDEALLARAQELSPADAFIFYLTFPTQADAPRQIRLQRGYEPPPYGEVHRIYFDRYSGEVLAHLRPDASLASRYLTTVNSQLHYGTLAGLTTKLIWMIACGLVPFFAVTGVLLWRRRARRRRHAAGHVPQKVQ